MKTEKKRNKREKQKHMKKKKKKEKGKNGKKTRHERQREKHKKEKKTTFKKGKKLTWVTRDIHVQNKMKQPSPSLAKGQFAGRHILDFNYDHLGQRERPLFLSDVISMIIRISPRDSFFFSAVFLFK